MLLCFMEMQEINEFFTEYIRKIHFYVFIFMKKVNLIIQWQELYCCFHCYRFVCLFVFTVFWSSTAFIEEVLGVGPEHFQLQGQNTFTVRMSLGLAMSKKYFFREHILSVSDYQWTRCYKCNSGAALSLQKSPLKINSIVSIFVNRAGYPTAPISTLYMFFFLSLSSVSEQYSFKNI